MRHAERPPGRPRKVRPPAPPSMAPGELREIRRRLKWSAADMASALALADGKSIRRYESGESPIPGPVAIAARALVLYDKPSLPMLDRLAGGGRVPASPA